MVLIIDSITKNHACTSLIIIIIKHSQESWEDNGHEE